MDVVGQCECLVMLNRKACKAEKRLGMAGPKITGVKSPVSSPKLLPLRPTTTATPSSQFKRTRYRPFQAFGIESVAKTVRFIVEAKI
jgi:hypothetical protein